MSASRAQRRRGAAAGGASSAVAAPSASAGSASAIGRLLLSALRDEVGVHDREQPRELDAVGDGQAGEDFVDHGVEAFAQARELLAALGGEVEPPCPPIVEIGPALDQPG